VAGDWGARVRPVLRHGTRTCYQHGCRRFECALANSRYIRAFRARAASTMVPARPVRSHLLFLNEQRAMGVTTIALVAGAHVRTVHDILRGRQRRVHADLARRLLGVFPSDDRFVDPASTWRRVHELQAVGVRQYEIGEVLRGYKPRTADPESWKKRWPGPAHRPFNLNRKPGGRIHRANAEAIERFYVRHFHEVLRRPTPEELRELRRAA
jgi:hypothetical protein